MRVRHLFAMAATMAAAVLAVTVVAGAADDTPAMPPTPTSTTSSIPTNEPDRTNEPEPTREAGGLRPGLTDAFARARAAAAGHGIDLPISSGYRSAAEQTVLLEREIEERGSLEQALHWVFRPEDSMHVRGLALDIGSGPAADWLDRHGAAFGLCRTLAWEWWHFEWRERWEAESRCPAPATSPDEAPEE